MKDRRGSFHETDHMRAGLFRLRDDRCVYLGNQLPKKNSDRCYGLTADERYLLVCEYGEGGADAEIVVFARRKI